MERRLYDNPHNFRHNTTDGRTDGRTPTASSNLLRVFSSVHLTYCTCFAFFRTDRSEGTNGGGTKAIILASEYPICTLLLWFSSIGFCFYLLGQPVLGVLRSSSARDPRWLAMRWSWDTWVGSAWSGGTHTSTRLASLIFNQNVRFIALHQAVALPVPSCSQFLPIKHFKPLHSPS
jgi:hypothetical protein